MLESENKDEQAKFDPGTDFLPALQPNSPLTLSSPNTAPEDTSGENKKDVSSDQVDEKTASDEDQHPSTIPEHKALETSNNKQA